MAVGASALSRSLPKSANVICTLSQDYIIPYFARYYKVDSQKKTAPRCFPLPFRNAKDPMLSVNGAVDPLARFLAKTARR